MCVPVWYTTTCKYLYYSRKEGEVRGGEGRGRGGRGKKEGGEMEEKSEGFFMKA